VKGTGGALGGGGRTGAAGACCCICCCEGSGSGCGVGVVLGSNYEKWLRDNAPKADIRTYDDDATRDQDLLSGRIDAVINDRLVAAERVKQYQGKLAAAGQPFAPQNQGIALRKGNPELLAALNKAIDDLRADGTLAKISNKWFGSDVTK